MIAKWGICALLIGLLTLASGCRTPQPNLKPADTAERFVEPPPGAYVSGGLPKQAMSTMTDPAKASLDAKASGVIPSRGMGPGGMGGAR
jgi:hypothetical protein